MTTQPSSVRRSAVTPSAGHPTSFASAWSTRSPRPSTPPGIGDSELLSVMRPRHVLRPVFDRQETVEQLVLDPIGIVLGDRAGLSTSLYLVHRRLNRPRVRPLAVGLLAYLLGDPGNAAY